jgi:hypothetical protein
MGRRPKKVARTIMKLTMPQRKRLHALKARNIKLRHDETTAETIWWHYFWEWRRHVRDGAVIRDQLLFDRFLELNQELMDAKALKPDQQKIVEELLPEWESLKKGK